MFYRYDINKEKGYYIESNSLEALNKWIKVKITIPKLKALKEILENETS